MYNGITDDDTHDDILNLSIVYLLWCWGLVVGRVAARCLHPSALFAFVFFSRVTCIFFLRKSFDSSDIRVVNVS